VIIMGKNKSNKKVINTFRDFLRTDSFQKTARELRVKYGILPSGISISDKELPEINQQTFPINFGSGDLYRELNRDIENLISGFPIKHWAVVFLSKVYIFYNDIERFVHLKPDFDYGVIEIFNLAEDLSTYDGGFDPDNGNSPMALLKEVVNRGDEYPIAIGVHKDATKRDLIDFISKNWKRIAGERSGEESRLLQVRTRREGSREMTDFIYRNRHMSRKKLANLVCEMFPEKLTRSIDAGSIGKIISIEKKRRK